MMDLLPRYQTRLARRFGISRNHAGSPCKISALLWITILLVPMVSDVSRADSPANTSLESLTESWKQREGLVKTAQLKFKSQHLIGKESHLDSTSIAIASKVVRPDGGLSGKRYPDHEVSAYVSISVELDGDKIRITEAGPRWEDRALRLVKTERVDLFDGDIYSRYIGVAEATDRVFKIAFLSNAKAKTVDDVGLVFPHMLPLIQAVRPVNKRFEGGRVGAWRVLAQTENIDAVQCVALVANSGKLSQRMWFDPTNFNSLVRWEVDFDTAPLIRSDINYRADGPDRFIPQSWSTTRFNPGTGEVADKYTISRSTCTLNEVIAPQVFQPAYPAGTLVTETTRPDITEQYVQLENGKRRIVTREETASGAPYTELIRTESGKAVGRPPASR